MAETDNILEILLRLCVGNVQPLYAAAPAISPPSVAGPLRAALSPGSPHSAQQTHVSLAVLAVWRMTIEYALRHSRRRSYRGRGAPGEIIRCLLHIYCIRAWTAFSRMEGREEEWQMNVYLLHPSVCRCRSQSFHIALHVGSFAEPGVLLLLVLF